MGLLHLAVSSYFIIIFYQGSSLFLYKMMISFIMEGMELDDVWVIGPLMMKEKWVLYVIAFIMSYTALRLAIKLKSIDHSVIDSLWNALFLFLVVWKLSYTLFHPIDVIRNPMSQLYFTGGEKGVVLALLSVVIYFLFKSKRNGLSFHLYMEIGLISVLTAIGIFQALVWIMYFPGLNHLLFEAMLSLVLLFYWFTKYESNRKWLWPKMIVWFSLGGLFISFFKPQIPMLLGFSFSQWVYIAVCFLVIVVSNRYFIKTL